MLHWEVQGFAGGKIALYSSRLTGLERAVLAPTFKFYLAKQPALLVQV